MSVEEELVKAIGERIGYGRTMQLCEQLWRDRLAKQGMEGGEFTSGPCALDMVPCLCTETSKYNNANGHCDWCCNTRRLTKRVLEAMENSHKKK